MSWTLISVCVPWCLKILEHYLCLVLYFEMEMYFINCVNNQVATMTIEVIHALCDFYHVLSVKDNCILYQFTLERWMIIHYCFCIIHRGVKNACYQSPFKNFSFLLIVIDQVFNNG